MILEENPLFSETSKLCSQTPALRNHEIQRTCQVALGTSFLPEKEEQNNTNGPTSLKPNKRNLGCEIQAILTLLYIYIYIYSSWWVSWQAF